MGDYVVGTILGGLLGGAMWLLFFKIFGFPLTKIGDYMEKKLGWPEWKVSLVSYPVMLLFFLVYALILIKIMEALGF